MKKRIYLILFVILIVFTNIMGCSEKIVEEPTSNIPTVSNNEEPSVEKVDESSEKVTSQQDISNNFLSDEYWGIVKEAVKSKVRESDKITFPSKDEVQITKNNNAISIMSYCYIENDSNESKKATILVVINDDDESVVSVSIFMR